MAESKKTVRFNVSRIVFAVVKEDTKSTFTHTEIEDLADPMQVQLTYTLASGVVYGAGVKKFSKTKITGITLQLDLNKVAIEKRAKIFGHKIENGVLKVNKEDQARKIAIGYELEAASDGADTRELEWLYKGDPQPFGKSTQQTTDNFNFSTDTMTINFVPRELDGDFKSEGDTAYPDFTEAAADAFLDTIPGGTLVTETEGG